MTEATATVTGRKIALDVYRIIGIMAYHHGCDDLFTSSIEIYCVAQFFVTVPVLTSVSFFPHPLVGLRLVPSVVWRDCHDLTGCKVALDMYRNTMIMAYCTCLRVVLLHNLKFSPTSYSYPSFMFFFSRPLVGLPFHSIRLSVGMIAWPRPPRPQPAARSPWTCTVTSVSWHTSTRGRRLQRSASSSTLESPTRSER